MKSPAVGVCLAKLILFEDCRTIDCSPLGWNQFRAGKLIHEIIVN